MRDTNKRRRAITAILKEADETLKIYTKSDMDKALGKQREACWNKVYTNNKAISEMSNDEIKQAILTAGGRT